MDGLYRVFIELTNRCNKSCWMCGRRKLENNGIVFNEEMDFDLLKAIAIQIPFGVLVSLHNNGESLLYSHLEAALDLFSLHITHFNTNGKLLLEKADNIIGRLTSLTISVIENDPEGEEQYDIISKFLAVKGNKEPMVVLRLLGNVDISKYKKFGCQIVERVLHSPMGSYSYEKKTIVSETGICQDFQNTMAIDKDGKVSICVRFDPECKGVIGNINDNTLEEIWNSPKRMKWLNLHVKGLRNQIPLCSKCDFWGIPRGY